MEIPGLHGPANERELLDAADQKAEQLLEELKSEVKAEIKELDGLRRELTITVPAKVIAAHIEHNYEELRQDAQVPGFRKGHAPRQLIEKRFGADVRQSLKTTIIGQAYFAATENNELEVLGDPLFRIEDDDGVNLVQIDEALQDIELPAEGDLTFTVELEVKPKFELPQLENIPVKTPEFEVTDEQVNEQLERHLKMRGRFEPIGDEPAQKDDLVIADVTLKSEGHEVKTEENVQVGVRPSRLDGISLNDLGERLAGAKIGQTVSVDCTIPDDYERADLRGKPGTFELKIQELKRLKPADVQALVAETGAESEEQLRQFIRDDMEAEKETMIRRAKKEQVRDYLLENTEVQLPEKLSARQVDRAVIRRVLELRQAGMPDSEVSAKIDELRTSAAEQVARDLKLSFILERVAEQLDVDVTDEEVNTEIAMMARRYNRRFDRVRDELQNEGLLSQLAEQIRQDKCIDRLLTDADQVPVKPEDQSDSNA